LKITIIPANITGVPVGNGICPKMFGAITLKNFKVIQDNTAMSAGRLTNHSHKGFGPYLNIMLVTITILKDVAQFSNLTRMHYILRNGSHLWDMRNYLFGFESA